MTVSNFSYRFDIGGFKKWVNQKNPSLMEVLEFQKSVKDYDGYDKVGIDFSLVPQNGTKYKVLFKYETGNLWFDKEGKGHFTEVCYAS
ncbi:MAG: hypothetical protein J6P28_03655 [Treponema sp.]|nr:hypothetical protein [Treponema sp.]